MTGAGSALPAEGAEPAEPRARVPLLPGTEALAVAAAAGVPEGMARLNVFRALLHHRKLAKGLNDFLGVLLSARAPASRWRELAIMRIAWTTGSCYEWTQHWHIAQLFGVPPEDLLAVRDWPASGTLGPADRAVLAATDDIVSSGSIGAAAWEELRRHVGADGGDGDGESSDGGDRQVVELVTAIGAWHMMSSVLRSLAIPLEDGVAPWPPDGLVPSAHGVAGSAGDVDEAGGAGGAGGARAEEPAGGTVEDGTATP